MSVWSQVEENADAGCQHNWIGVGGINVVSGEREIGITSVCTYRAWIVTWYYTPRD